jgi:hypothetical protein
MFHSGMVVSSYTRKSKHALAIDDWCFDVPQQTLYSTSQLPP